MEHAMLSSSAEIGTGPIRFAILVHSRGSFRKALNALPLRTTFLRPPVTGVD